MASICNPFLDCEKNFGMSAEKLLLNLFYVDTNGCVGIYMNSISVATCNDITPVITCENEYTLDKAVSEALTVDDCGKVAINVFTIPIA